MDRDMTQDMTHEHDIEDQIAETGMAYSTALHSLAEPNPGLGRNAPFGAVPDGGLAPDPDTKC